MPEEVPPVPEHLKHLPEATPPFAILEIPDGTTVHLRVVGWNVYRALIRPRYPGAPPYKWVKLLRIHLPPEIKPSKISPTELFKKKEWTVEDVRAFTGLPWVDITASTLVEQLIPLLSRPDYFRYEYLITAMGIAPKKRYSVEVRPLG